MKRFGTGIIRWASPETTGNYLIAGGNEFGVSRGITAVTDALAGCKERYLRPIQAQPNIGLQRGIIGPALFSMLVLMAIVTTLMASPMFELVYGRRARASGALGRLADDAEEEQASPPARA